MNDLIREFRFGTLRLTLAPRQDLVFKEFPGFTLHRAFGRALQIAACKDPGCDGNPCVRPAECAFGLFWSPKADALTPKRYTSVPCPIIVSIPEPSGSYYTVRGSGADEEAPPEVRQPVAWPEGHPLTMEIVLVGRALDHLHTVTAAVDLLCGRFGLGPERVKLDRTVSGDGDGPMFGEWRDLALPSDRHCPVAEVEFATPMWLEKGKEVVGLLFHEVALAIARRLAILVYTYCLPERNLDLWRELEDWTRDVCAEAKAGVQRLAHREEYARDWYGSRVKKEDFWMHGYLGRAIYAGEPGGFLPLLRAGQLIRAGKGTEMGWGQIRLASTDLEPG